VTEQNNVSLNPKAPEQGERLHRGLSNRHIQLIAIGGAIGTGLFMGSGRAISLAGPSVIFVYMLIGAVIFLVLRLPSSRLTSPIDWWGLGLMNAGAIAIVLMATWGGNQYAWTSPVIIGLGIVGLVCDIGQDLLEALNLGGVHISKYPLCRNTGCWVICCILR